MGIILSQTQCPNCKNETLEDNCRSEAPYIFCSHCGYNHSPTKLIEKPFGAFHVTYFTEVKTIGTLVTQEDYDDFKQQIVQSKYKKLVAKAEVSRVINGVIVLEPILTDDQQSS